VISLGKPVASHWKCRCVPGLLGLSLWDAGVAAELATERLRQSSGWLPRAESLARLKCGGLVSDVLECPCCTLDLCERHFPALDAETREPPQRGALEPIRLRATDRHAHRKGVDQVNVRQLAAALRMMAMLPVFSARRKRE
jgi:hypothetical protein